MSVCLSVCCVCVYVGVCVCVYVVSVCLSVCCVCMHVCVCVSVCIYTYIILTDAELNDSGTDDGEKIISLLRSFVVEVCKLYNLC